MNRRQTAIRLSLLLLAIFLVSTCKGDNPTQPPSLESARPTAITVGPATVELTTLGATVQLTAEVRDQNARIMVGAPLTWDSDDAAVATVDATGLVTAVGDGAATITANAGSAVGSAAIEVFDFTGMLERFADQHGISAGALGVMMNGEIVYEGAVGHMDAERQVRIRQDVMMRIASVTKPITAAAVRHLADRGMLALDDRVFDLGRNGGGILDLEPFPELGDPRLAEITVLHLLQHRGGWDRDRVGTPGHFAIADAMAVPSPPGLENTIRYILGQPLQFDPGARRSYSNIGYRVLGLVIEGVSGQDYMTYVRENIFAPLGVPTGDVIQGRTFPEDRSEREPWYDPAGRPMVRNVFDPSGPRVPWPDGGWDHEAIIASGGIVASTRAILEFLDTYQVAPDNDIGLRRRESEAAHWRKYHTGALPGANALARQRGDGINYVALFNRRDQLGPDHVDYARRFRDMMDDRLNSTQ